MRNYQEAHASFPHETTADQFFDDAQFESYRALGNHLAEHTFGPVLDPALAPFSDPWLRRLLSAHASFRAVDEPAYWKASAGLAEIERTLAGDPDRRWYYEECYPAAAGGQPAVAPAPRPSVTGVFLAQARLMEQVCLKVDLERHGNAPDNRGWMNVFRAWGRSPTFQAEFAAAKDLFVRKVVEFYTTHIQGRPPIAHEPIPHPWDVNFPKDAPRVFLDPGLREAGSEPLRGTRP